MLTIARLAKIAAAIALAAPFLWGGPAAAQGTSHSSAHQGAAAGYHAAMEKMNRDMAAETPSGNADRDFASMMAKHHQAAIDMARVELEHGRDAEMRRTAQEIIEKQQKEIADLRAWMSRHPAR
ncbi:CopM family metallochaperone [Roseomonas chloroacetimidivorans]|uniref:CopM family metallochaperone n=1 Tax=Roseomonas chloroacetimidivorans TaxID=1766656 RepID=UPI003C750CCA